jgi:hypothetical protein
MRSRVLVARRLVGAVVVGALVVGGAIVACKKPPVDETSEGPAPTGSTSARPPDRLAPDELLEGTEKALGLVLPRGTRIDGAFPDTVNATIDAKLGPVVEYLRARVREGTFTKGQFTATFEHVKIPARPGRELRIRVNEVSGVGTKLEIFDSTPPPVADLPDDEARLRAVGLTKDGKLLDPKHLE